MRRVIQKRLEDGISEELLRGRFTSGDTIVVEREEDSLSFSRKETMPVAVNPQPDLTADEREEETGQDEVDEESHGQQ